MEKKVPISNKCKTCDRPLMSSCQQCGDGPFCGFHFSEHIRTHQAWRVVEEGLYKK